jgi:vancomycin resistance protein YoaR
VISCAPTSTDIRDASISDQISDPISDFKSDITHDSSQTEFINLFKYETKFKYSGIKYESRAKNIELIVNMLNGLTIEPGQEFSFNKIIGPRIPDAGFLSAPAIFMGEMTEDFGGGACQVSSTLHAAVRFSGLKIIEHHNHSRPSEYIEMGLDSTVSYPDLDFKFRNQFDYPIQINLSTSIIDDKYKNLLIMINGQVDSGMRVSHKFRIQGYEQYSRVIKTTGKFRGKFKKKLQNGSPGLIGLSVFKYEYQTGEIKYDKKLVKYKPVNEVYDVGPNFDKDSLAPLP